MTDTPAAIFLKQSNDPLPRPRSFVPDLPEEVEKVLYKALAKNPEERYASMGDFAAALEGLIAPTKPLQSQAEIEALRPEAPESPAVPNLPVAEDIFKTKAARLEIPAPLTAGAPPPTVVKPTPVGETPPKADRADNIPLSLPLAPRPESTRRGGSKRLLAGLLGLLGIVVVIGLAMTVINHLSPARRVPYLTQTQAASKVASMAAPVLMAPTTVTNGLMTKTAEQAGSSKLKIGLVTDTGGVNDKSFNQSAWAGVQKAGKDLNLDINVLESKQPTDYEKNIDTFATQNYDVIITVGFLMGDATAAKARQYPKIKFALIDFAYAPAKGSPACPNTVKDCYVDGGLTNVTSLMFQENQVGFLAGVLAGGMTKTGTVCTVSGMEIPPVVRYVTGYQNGARWEKPDIKTLNVYIPSFTDPATGKEDGVSMISQGCDVVFGVGGNTGNGGLLAAKEANLMAIGVDVDQYNTYPEVRSALISSAMKNVDVAVYNYLKSITDKSVKAGAVTANIQNGGVGLAPFHDWDSKIPVNIKARIQEATDGLKNGTISRSYSQGQLKIAVLAPLSGPFPTFGVSTRDGALLAIKQWNDAGGVLGMQVQAIVEDSQCMPDPAVNAANKVIDQDKVHYIMGEVCSSASITVSEIANAKHVVQISGTSTNPGVVRYVNGNVKPYTFVACFNDDTQGKVMAKFAYSTLNAKTAFIMYDQANDYVKGLATFFEKYFTADGGTIVGKETYTSKDTDFSTILAKVANTKPDLVVLPDYYNVINLVTKQAKQQGITTPFIGGDGWDSPDLDAVSASGGYFTNHYSPTENRPAVQTFVKLYGQTYKDDKGNPKVPDALAALGYDATNILLEGIKETGVDDPIKVKDTIAKGKFEAVSGTITFDAFHTPIKPVTIIQVKDGKVVFNSQVMP